MSRNPYSIEPRYARGDASEERDIRITHTMLGIEYGWDSFADINWAMLRQNHEALLGILDNPRKFPRADIPTLTLKEEALGDFLLLYGIGREAPLRFATEPGYMVG